MWLTLLNPSWSIGQRFKVILKPTREWNTDQWDYGKHKSRCLVLANMVTKNNRKLNALWYFRYCDCHMNKQKLRIYKKAHVWGELTKANDEQRSFSYTLHHCNHRDWQHYIWKPFHWGPKSVWLPVKFRKASYYPFKAENNNKNIKQVDKAGSLLISW